MHFIEEWMWRVRKTSIIFFLIASFNFLTISGAENNMETTTVFISDSVRVEAEIAVTDEQRAKGLMFRKSLPADAGMLFIFPALEHHSFWMKNTLIPLDIIWLNERKQIVYFITADPCVDDPCRSYGPMQKAKYVLEVNAGFVKKHGLKIGQQFEFTIDPKLRVE